MKKAISVMLCVILLLMAHSLPMTVFAADKNIDGIEIIGVDIAIGGTPNASDISAPSGAKYKITNKGWYDNTGRTREFSKFQDLHKYTLELTVEVDEGYSIDCAPYIKVNGKAHAAVSVVQYDRELFLNLDFSFLKPINKVEMPAFPDAVPMGKSYPSDAHLQNQKLVETEMYTVYGDWSQRIPDKGTFGEFMFEEGAMYAYEMSIGVKSGYEITADTVFTAGGKAVSRDNVYHYFYDSNAAVYRLFNHTSLKPISVVDITVAAPTIGNKIDTQAKTDTAGVEIDKFFIQETTSANVIVPREMGNTMLTIQSTDGNYAADKQYIAKGYIKAANGYYFAEDLTIRVNGKKVTTFPSYIYNMFGAGSPTKANPFILLMGKPTVPTTTTTTAKPTEAKPTTTVAPITTTAVDDQTDIGEPTASVADDSATASTAPVEDTVTNGTSDKEESSVLPIVLAVVGGVMLVLGGTAGVMLWIKKKKS